MAETCGVFKHDMVGGYGKCVNCGMTLSETEVEYRDEFPPRDVTSADSPATDPLARIESKIDTVIAQQAEFINVLTSIKDQAEPFIETLANHPMAKMFGLR